MKTAQTPTARNLNFDCLRCFCAFLIVYIHCPYPSVLGAYCIAIARAAVPTFFMLSGYFYNPAASKQKHLAQIKKVFLWALAANLVYFGWELFISLFIGRSLDAFIALFFSPTQILSLVLLNDVSFGGHLWYLGALLYLLIFIYLTDRFSLRKWVQLLCPFLLAAGCLLGQYSFVLGRDFEIALYRNFLLLGLPCFCFGAWVRKKSAEKKDVFSKKKIRLYGFLSILFALTSLAEGWYFITVYAASGDYYISSILLGGALLLLALETSKRPHVGRVQHLTATIGGRYGLLIYVMHPLILTCANLIMAAISGICPPMAVFYSTFGTILIFSAALLFAICYQGMLRKLCSKQ